MGPMTEHRRYNIFRLFVWDFDDDDEPRLPLDQCCDEGSPGAFNQVPLPVPWYRSILDFRRPLPY